MAQFRAKFKVTEVKVIEGLVDPARSIKFSVVTDGGEENKSFSLYTPSGNVDLWVTNPDLFPVLDNSQGKEFYLDFTEVSPA